MILATWLPNYHIYLPHCIGYNCGNLMSYLPVYDVNVNVKCNNKLRQNSRSVNLTFFREARNKFFNDRSDSVAIAQRDCLNDASVYVINKKSLLINKPQVFYNDDSLDSYCLPLTTNSQWSESFLGNCMNFDNKCKYEESLWSIALDIDWPKVCLFEKDGLFYSMPLSPISGSSPMMTWTNDALFGGRQRMH